MKLTVTAFGVSKAGNKSEENDDAFAFGSSNGTRRFAVADGVTQSVSPGRWARLLVKKVATARLEGRRRTRQWVKLLQCWIKRPQQEWQADIDWQHLPWYLEEKAQRGAFATLLGLEISKKGRGKARMWAAYAIGDCCLFLVRNNKLHTAFPLTRTTEFTNRPWSLSSMPQHNRGVWQAVQTHTGTCRPGDTFFLTTDALGQWFLAQHEAGVKPWKLLDQITDQQDFETLVNSLRDKQLIENDDTTLMRIALVAVKRRKSGYALACAG